MCFLAVFEHRGAVVINEDVELGRFWFCWQRKFGYPPETVAGNCNIGGSPVNEKTVGICMYCIL